MTRRLDQGFAAFEAWRDEILEEEEREQHKLDRKIVAEEHWLRYGVTARRKRNVRRLGELAGAAPAIAASTRAASAACRSTRREAEQSGTLVVEAEDIAKVLWRPRRSCATSPCASCAATGSASSARTAPARPR